MIVEPGAAPARRLPARLLGPDGAAFALLPVPTFDTSELRVDVELLSPDRVVRYLSRPMSPDFAVDVAGFLLRAASDHVPEETVGVVEDRDAGLALSVVESTPLAVTLEVVVLTDVQLEEPDVDGIAFDLPRASLIEASHAVGEWWT